MHLKTDNCYLLSPVVHQPRSLSAVGSLTLSLYWSGLWAAWFWLCSVSRSRLHLSWKRQWRKEKMKFLHKETVMWLRDGWRLFLRRRGEKRGGETESHSLNETEKGGERPVGERGSVCQSESKSFSQLHRDRLFYLNSVLWTSAGLSRENSDWISGKVGR